jgi:hypothetical protein
VGFQSSPASSTPSATDLLPALITASSGIGVATMSFLAAVPGFLPMIMLLALGTVIGWRGVHQLPS